MNYRTYRARRYIRPMFIYLLLSSVSFIAISPYLWMVMTSFKNRVDAFTIPPVWLFKPTVGHYIAAFFDKGFAGNLLNSLIISLSTVGISLILGVLSAYAFARYKLSGDHHIFFYILTTRMSPPVAMAVPLYMLMAKFGILNTYFAVIIAHITFNLALVVWMMRGFFEAVPVEIEEAALVDGCSTIQAFRLISLPLVRGGVAATAILCFIFSWNEFLFALLLSGRTIAPLTVAIPGLVTTRGTFWGQIAAVATLITIPVIIFSFIVQRHLIRGLTFGAVKE